MEIFLTSEGRPSSYKAEICDSDELSLALIFENGSNVTLETALKKDSTFQGKAFDTYLLTSPEVKESDAGQVMLAGERIGWLIPVLSLVSNLHTEADNPYFLKYAYAAIRDCCKSRTVEDWKRRVELNGRDVLSVTDLFDESHAFLVLSHEKLCAIDDFDILKLAPSLASYGYLPSSNDDGGRYKLRQSGVDFKKYKLILASNDIEDIFVIYSLIRSYAQSCDNSILGFFYLYQIIEFLLELVFSSEQKRLVTKIIDAGEDSAKVKSALEKVQEYTSEKKRMGLLFDRYTGSHIDTKDLCDACNNLLEQLSEPVGTSVKTCLYPVRNYVFHRYRAFPEESLETLSQINDVFVDILPFIFAKFLSNPTFGTEKGGRG